MNLKVKAMREGDRKGEPASLSQRPSSPLRSLGLALMLAMLAVHVLFFQIPGEYGPGSIVVASVGFLGVVFFWLSRRT